MSHRPESDGWTRAPAMGTRALIGNLGFYQMSNVQRSSRSGLKCQCVGSDIDSPDVRIPSPVRLNDLGRRIGTLVGGANFIHGATGIVWLTGVSISLNAVSGSSAMGTTEMKMTVATTRSRNIHSLRFTTGTPIACNLLPRMFIVKPCRIAPQPMGYGKGKHFSTTDPASGNKMVDGEKPSCQVFYCPIG